jgi:hypothetical protein
MTAVKPRSLKEVKSLATGQQSGSQRGWRSFGVALVLAISAPIATGAFTEINNISNVDCGQAQVRIYQEARSEPHLVRSLMIKDPSGREFYTYSERLMCPSALPAIQSGLQDTPSP